MKKEYVIIGIVLLFVGIWYFTKNKKVANAPIYDDGGASEIAPVGMVWDITGKWVTPEWEASAIAKRDPNLMY